MARCYFLEHLIDGTPVADKVVDSRCDLSFRLEEYTHDWLLDRQERTVPIGEDDCIFLHMLHIQDSERFNILQWLPFPHNAEPPRQSLILLPVRHSSDE